MDKKLIYSLIVIVLICLGVYGLLMYHSTYDFKIGTSSASIPENFKVTHTASSSATLTDNKTTLGVYEAPDGTDINEVFKDYYKKHEKENVVNSTIDLGNNQTIKVFELKKDDKLIHKNYWYEKNNKIYHIYATGTDNEKAIGTIVNTTSINVLPFI